jgi:DUF4097 and DUF4098 domain-containing protein YvlB
MTLALSLGLLAALASGSGPTDTTVAVRPGARLEMHLLGGDIVVRTWNRAAVRVEAEGSERDRVEISYGGAVLRVGASSRHGAPRSVDFTLTVPATMDLSLSGTYSDIRVDGTTANVVTLGTVQGDITLHGGGSLVTLHSVGGDVHVSGVRGQLEAHTTNGDVVVEDTEGGVTAETVNGDVTLRAIRSGDVSATTVNGEITYRGTIRDNGQYRLSNHNGDVTVAVPPGTNATVTVSTFSGDFESDFPVTLSGTRQNKRFSFTIGTGSATLDLESFQGAIRLERP